MAFNGSGTFVRSFTWATDKANAVAVTASRFDTEDDGFATGLSTCICKDGQTTTTARIPFALGIGLGTGTVSLPAINFTSDTNTGIYSIGADNLGVACGGAKVLDVATTGLGVTGVITSTSDITAGRDLIVTRNVGITGTVSMSSTLGVTGLATFTTLTTTGQLIASTALNVGTTLTVGTTSALSGAVTCSSTLTVAGVSTFNNPVFLAGISTSASAANAFIDNANSNNILRSTSSKRYKTNIENISAEEARQILSRLRPIKFNSTAKADDPDRQHFGLIAEEVAEVDPRLVHFTEDGKPDGVQYDRVLIPLLKVFQEMRP